MAVPETGRLGGGSTDAWDADKLTALEEAISLGLDVSIVGGDTSSDFLALIPES